MVSSTPRPHFNPGKDPVPILQEAGWAPGPVWTEGKSRPHRDSIPDRPARSSVAIPTELPGPRTCISIAEKNERILQQLAVENTSMGLRQVIGNTFFLCYVGVSVGSATYTRLGLTMA